MKKLALIVSALLVTALLAGQAFADYQSFFKKTRVAVICFSTGEQVSGMNKICFYDCLGSEAAITVRATSLCPLTINR